MKIDEYVLETFSLAGLAVQKISYCLYIVNNADTK